MNVVATPSGRYTHLMVRLTNFDRDAVEAAAKRVNSSLSSFVRGAALMAAGRVLAEERPAQAAPAPRDTEPQA